MPNNDWSPDRTEVERLAYQYWEERGCEHGCHDEDWHRAEAEIRRARGEAMPRPDRTVVGVFHSLTDAQKAYEQLQTEGFSKDEISFVTNQVGVGMETSAASTGGEVAADAGLGAALGGVGGLLLGFAGLAVPGVGPVLAAGPIIAAIGGAGVGAAAGGLIGALTEGGVPESEAGAYAEGLRRGDTVLTVHAHGERADNASRILDQNGAVNIDDRISAWRRRGWTEYDPAAVPLSADELRREREYYSSANRQGKEWSKRSRSERRAAARAAEEDVRTSRVYLKM